MKERESWVLVQLGSISFSPLNPVKKQLVSPFSSLFYIESSAASHLGPGGLRIENSAVLDVFQSILCSWATSGSEATEMLSWAFGTSGTRIV